MDTILLELQNVEQKIDLLQKDIEYLANCYINDNNNFELPLSDDDTMVEIEYHVLFEKVKQKILSINPSIYIEDNKLMGYIDYYYQFIN